MQKHKHIQPSADHDSAMTLHINRRGFLQALIAAGAGYVIPAKATEAQIDQIWDEAQTNPWFFEVNDHGTLVEEGVREPETWGDIFGYLARSDFKDPESIVLELQECYPLAVYLNAELGKEIESLEEDLNTNSPESKRALTALKKKIDALKGFLEEYEDPWQDWVELEGKKGAAKFKALVEEWLADPIDWMQAESIPVRSGSQGAALGFFQDQPYELLKALGVVIVEGEHPGSSYYAAELKGPIDKANATAEQLGLPFRFKTKTIKEPDLPAEARWQPSKLAVAICGEDDVEALRRIDGKIANMPVLAHESLMTRELNETIKRFIFDLPVIRTVPQAEDRKRKAGIFGRNVTRFVYALGRNPDQKELSQIWDAT